MRVALKARSLVLGTTVAGATLIALSAAGVASAPLELLAVLAAVVVLTELLQVPSDPGSIDPADAHLFSFSSGAHIAAILVVGPWEAALIAAFGVVAVDAVRGARPLQVAFNASVFALASAAAGGAFVLLGGTPGALSLPGDLPAVAAAALVYPAVNTLLVSAVIGLESGLPAWMLVRESARFELGTAAGEAGFGLALAWSLLTEPWSAVALVPLVFAAYQALARLAQLRRETVRALETFANVVDERDAYTYRHSTRVSEHVGGLGEALGLPATRVARLRWAGRLHDLGKITVDASILHKPGALDAEEWDAMRRHPRLSARLLRAFRFAAEETRAVEFHHERFDGRGYLGVDATQVPLAAHMLVVADTFDAMTSDRPYRPALPEDDALAEIERLAGSQFHPAVARAFVAYRRGRPPADVLTLDELDALRAAPRRPLPSARRLAGRLPDAAPIAATVAALLLLAGGRMLEAAGAALAVSLALLWLARESRRRRRILEALDALGGGGLPAVAGALARERTLRWAVLLRWDERRLTSSVAASWPSEPFAPSVESLESWILREPAAPGDVLLGHESESGRVAVPFGDGDRTDGYLVLGFAARPPRPVVQALREADEILRGLLAAETGDAAPPALQLVAAS